MKRTSPTLHGVPYDIVHTHLFSNNAIYVYIQKSALERQARELHMLRTEDLERMKKRQLTGLEPATSGSIADLLAAES